MEHIREELLKQEEHLTATVNVDGYDHEITAKLRCQPTKGPAGLFTVDVKLRSTHGMGEPVAQAVQSLISRAFEAGRETLAKLQPQDNQLALEL